MRWFVVCAPVAIGALLSFVSPLSEPSNVAHEDEARPELLGASVSPTGRLLRGAGVTHVQHVAPGRYAVTFSRSTAGCIRNATLGSGSNVPPAPDGVEVRRSRRDDDTLHVRTYTLSGAPADNKFTVAVYCEAEE
jgi:hypothetical protein